MGNGLKHFDKKFVNIVIVSVLCHFWEEQLRNRPSVPDSYQRQRRPLHLKGVHGCDHPELHVHRRPLRLWLWNHLHGQRENQGPDNLPTGS